MTLIEPGTEFMDSLGQSYTVLEKGSWEGMWKIKLHNPIGYFVDNCQMHEETIHSYIEPYELD